VFPNLITHVATTGATVTDHQMTEPVHGALAARNLASGRHYTDSGYASAALVVSALAAWGIALIAPASRAHAPGRQPRRPARPLPRPAQDPPRPRRQRGLGFQEFPLECIDLCCGLARPGLQRRQHDLKRHGARLGYSDVRLLPRHAALPKATRAADPAR
jgi:hypothetical protein